MWHRYFHVIIVRYYAFVSFFSTFFFIKERFGCPGLFTTMVLVGTGVGIMECITGGGADGIWVGGGLETGPGSDGDSDEVTFGSGAKISTFEG